MLKMIGNLTSITIEKQITTNAIIRHENRATEKTYAGENQNKKP